MAKEKAKVEERHSPRLLNRRARHDYHVLEVVECGIELTGTEVKSLRDGLGKIDEAYARIQGRELVLIDCTIPHYAQASPALQHESARPRKLLVHRRQIEALVAHVKQKGKTLVPLALYFKRGWAKVEIGVVIGKKQFDKREDIKKRDAQKDIARAMNRRRRE